MTNNPLHVSIFVKDHFHCRTIYYRRRWIYKALFQDAKNRLEIMTLFLRNLSFRQMPQNIWTDVEIMTLIHLGQIVWCYRKGNWSFRLWNLNKNGEISRTTYSKFRVWVVNVFFTIVVDGRISAQSEWDDNYQQTVFQICFLFSAQVLADYCFSCAVASDHIQTLSAFAVCL